MRNCDLRDQLNPGKACPIIVSVTVQLPHAGYPVTSSDTQSVQPTRRGIHVGIEMMEWIVRKLIKASLLSNVAHPCKKNQSSQQQNQQPMALPLLTDHPGGIRKAPSKATVTIM